MLISLFQKFVNLSYRFRVFKAANTIALKKPGVVNFTTSKAYKLITLLNTLNKIFESIVARKIIYLAEKYDVLPVTHMGTQNGRSTKSAFELFIEQVHTIWGQNNDKTATFLSINVVGTFDTMSYRRLIHNLRK